MNRDPAEILTAYADGELSEAERVRVEAALEADPALRGELAAIRAAQDALRTLPQAPPVLSPEARQRLLAGVERAWTRPPRRRLRRLLPYAVAAGVLLAIGGGILTTSTVHYLAPEGEPACEVPPVRIASVEPPPRRNQAAGAASIALPLQDMRSEQLEMLQALDLPADEAAREGDSRIAKGREEAISETESANAFLAIGAGGRARQSADEKKERRAGDKQTTVDELTRSIVNAVKPAPARPAIQEPRLPAIPAQTPTVLASRLANIAPAPILARDPVQRLLNLAENYELPVELPQRRLPLATALPIAPGLSAGEQVVMLANRAGAQVVLDHGRLAMRAPAALDPTDRLGMDAAAFAAAWGSPPMTVVAQDPGLTFALDADTASFDSARAELDAGRLPDPASLRPEHFVNAVPADYPRPTAGEAFALFAEAGPSPFARGPLAARQALVAVGVVGRDAAAGERRPLHLVVALDTSGSMAAPGTMDIARIALDGLFSRLDARDRVAVTAFGERARVVQPAIGGDRQDRLMQALRQSAQPDGATNLAEGIALAIQVAREMADPDAALRVVLVTDGAAIAGPEEAEARVRASALRASGGSLLLLGVGSPPADTRALDSLVAAGDGQRLHLGGAAEARAVVDGALLPGRLDVLARDAKAQVQWNPERVTHARLVGYERRRLDHGAFRDDRVDAGELAAATTATALFEVVLAEGGSGPLGTASVRYVDTRRGAVRELAHALPGSLLAAQASPRLRTLACAAELAEQLRGSWWANVRPIPFAAIAAACDGLPAPADTLARMARQADGLRPLLEVRP